MFQLTLLTRMEQFIMSYNAIGGRIPPSFLRLTDLHTFVMIDNRLTGTIPELLFSDRMSSLKVVELSRNRWTGALPGQMNSTKLTEVRAYNNTLNGTVPSSIGNLKSLGKVHRCCDLLLMCMDREFSPAITSLLLCSRPRVTRQSVHG